MKLQRISSTQGNIVVSLRTMCQNGMLLHAARAIKAGLADWEVSYQLNKKHQCGNREQIDEIVRLAHLALEAGRLFNELPPDGRLPECAIPRIT